MSKKDGKNWMWNAETGNAMLDELINNNIILALNAFVESLCLHVNMEDGKLRVSALSDFEFTRKDGVGSIYWVEANLDGLVSDFAWSVHPYSMEFEAQVQEQAEARAAIVKLVEAFDKHEDTVTTRSLCPVASEG